LRERFVRDESGFTLPKLLVTMLMMLTVFFALHSIFDMGIRVFSFGNDKTEATENARLGLERMERELRAAYPYDKAAGNTTIIASGTPNEVTFGNDLNGDRVVNSDEVITYRRSVGDPTILQRENNGQTQPLAGFVRGLTFEYVDPSGNAVAASGANRVRVSLAVEVDRGINQPVTQKLTIDVALENRSN
jgi:type II secretory pathway component PulJ